MNEQTDYDNCGNFDHTADECQLPPNHYDPPQINSLFEPATELDVSKI